MCSKSWVIGHFQEGSILCKYSGIEMEIHDMT